MSSWRDTTLDNLVRLQRGHDLPTSARNAGDIPVVGAAGPSGLHDTARAKGPGVVLGRAGASMGQATYCINDYWPLNTALYVTDFLGNDPRFVYYLLTQIDFSGYNSGAAQPMLNRNYIKQISITLPAVDEQRRISSCLGALDDKIAVNDRIADIAEKLCLAHFSNQSGFAAIPVAKLCHLEKKQSDPRALSNASVLHYSLPSFDALRAPEATDPHKIKSSKFMVPSSAILVSKLNPEIPRVWHVRHDGEVPALASTEFLVLVPVEGVSTAELWAVLSQPAFMATIAAKVTGTSKSHQRVNPAEIMGAKIADPRLFGQRRQLAEALLRRVLAARQETRTLRELRDALLPELTSGQLRVRAAEKVVEEAV